MDKNIYAVAGNPILHSKSPQLFSAAFQKENISAVYTRLHAESAKEVVQTVREIGIQGINVTAPFKESVIPFLDEICSDAKQIQSVNCIVVKNGKLVGYNTDFIGVLNSLSASGVSVAGKKCLVIGAGGAAKATVYALMREGGSVTVVNRSFDRAKTVADHFEVVAKPLKEVDKLLPHTDILISTIPFQDGVFNLSLLPKNATVFDAHYGNSPLLDGAKNEELNTISGEEWLINQALPSFELFFNKKTDYATMKMGLTKKVLKKSPLLVGFMMSGKTKIGREITKNNDIPFYDIDSMISAQEKLTITEIFTEKGEQHFRKIESAVLQECVGKKGVISSGGGIVVDHKNRAILKEHFPVVWLFSSLSETIKRLEYQGGIERKSRPLLHGSDWKDIVEKLFNERLNLYAEVADVIVNTTEFRQERLAKIVTNQYISLR